MFQVIKGPVILAMHNFIYYLYHNRSFEKNTLKYIIIITICNIIIDFKLIKYIEIL